MAAKREESIMIRVSPKEKRAIEQAAARDFLTVSAWARATLLRYTDDSPLAEPECKAGC